MNVQRRKQMTLYPFYREMMKNRGRNSGVFAAVRSRRRRCVRWVAYLHMHLASLAK